MIQAAQARLQSAEFHVEHPQDPASLAAPKDQRPADTGDFLIVSPYPSMAHLLDLRTLDVSQQLFAKALTVLEEVREDYSTAPYNESFNWEAVIRSQYDSFKDNGITIRRDTCRFSVHVAVSSRVKLSAFTEAMLTPELTRAENPDPAALPHMASSALLHRRLPIPCRLDHQPRRTQ